MTPSASPSLAVNSIDVADICGDVALLWQVEG